MGFISGHTQGFKDWSKHWQTHGFKEWPVHLYFSKSVKLVLLTNTAIYLANFRASVSFYILPGSFIPHFF